MTPEPQLDTQIRKVLQTTLDSSRVYGYTDETVDELLKIVATAVEKAVKVTISQFKQMNIKDPGKAINLDDAERRALESLTPPKGSL